MNSSISEKEKIWDEFLTRWPLEKLGQITLQEYTQAGGAESFTYWLEAKTEKLGSIWGGSSFKFGVYSRRNQSDKEDGAGKSYSTEYGWYNKYGATAEEAFEQVRKIVVEVANAARVGNLGVIQQANLGLAVKWKIAFLYQNRNQPCILPIYDLKHLRAATGMASNNLQHADLYAQLMKSCGENSVINHGVQLWEKAVTVLDSEKSNLAAREQIAKHFFSHERFREYWENTWEQETRELFIDYAVTIHNIRFDWWIQNGKGFLCFGRKNQDDKSGAIVGYLNPKKWGLDVLWNAIGEYDGQEQQISQAAIDFWQSDELLALASDLYPSSRDGYWADSYSSNEISRTEKNNTDMNIANLILYGPPGTGKTYSTIDEALKILDPVFFEHNAKQRSLLKQRFDELISTKQIRFVTFHQSMSYEDFVEGLGAETDDETKQIQYKVENGIFKNLCLDAQKPIANNNNLEVSENPRIWKISIESANDNDTKRYCFANGEARIGWGHIGDLNNVDLTDPALDIGTNDRNSLRNFAQEIQPGDILLCIASITEVGAVGIVQSGYIYQEVPPQSVRDDYKNVLKVNWVLKNIHFSILPLNNDFRFPVKTVSEMERLNWTELAIALQKSGYSLPTFKPYSEMQKSDNPHVLIIDEINRGNISRIFGELITLIEESKRTGADEALEVILPYSKKPFSVPSNVYLIGTMNTADRSLAGLDIALRRRFTFKEMPPKPELLDGIVIDGVDIKQMLFKMNDRIEVLLDRDHCLGHAYFMPLKINSSIENLACIFRQQILPLLEEYFFEDWERIAWVLNDQNKKQPEHKFLKNMSADLSSLSNLFGDQVAGNLQDRRWHINEEAFGNIESYRGILGASE